MLYHSSSKITILRFLQSLWLDNSYLTELHTWQSRESIMGLYTQYFFPNTCSCAYGAFFTRTRHTEKGEDLIIPIIRNTYATLQPLHRTWGRKSLKGGQYLDTYHDRISSIWDLIPEGLLRILNSIFQKTRRNSIQEN